MLNSMSKKAEIVDCLPPGIGAIRIVLFRFPGSQWYFEDSYHSWITSFTILTVPIVISKIRDRVPDVSERFAHHTPIKKSEIISLLVFFLVEIFPLILFSSCRRDDFGVERSKRLANPVGSRSKGSDKGSPLQVNARHSSVATDLVASKSMWGDSSRTRHNWTPCQMNGAAFVCWLELVLSWS